MVTYNERYSLQSKHSRQSNPSDQSNPGDPSNAIEQSNPTGPSSERTGNLVLTLSSGQAFFLIHPDNESFIGFHLVSSGKTRVVLNATPRLIILREKLASHFVLKRFRDADVSTTVDIAESLLMVIRDDDSPSETVRISTSGDRRRTRFDIKVVDARKTSEPDRR